MTQQDILLLDHHDSFTWNLVELLRSLGKNKIKIVRPEEVTLPLRESYNRVIFSPGPGIPAEHPAMFRILKHLESNGISHNSTLKILGVCLGMQAIVEFFGGHLVRQEVVVHGQPRKLLIREPKHPFFSDIPQGNTVGLYHSWAADRKFFPACLEIIAESEDGVIMAVQHRTIPVLGVQFHPESVITENGSKMLSNWLEEP